MILGNYLAAATLFCVGLYAVLSHLIKIVMGLSLMEASTYLLLVSLAYRRGATSPVLLNPPAGQTPSGLAHGNVADPVLQNGRGYPGCFGTNGFCRVVLAGSALVAASGSALLGSDPR